jgi:hypothetical protein
MPGVLPPAHPPAKNGREQFLAFNGRLPLFIGAWHLDVSPNPCPSSPSVAKKLPFPLLSAEAPAKEDFPIKSCSIRQIHHQNPPSDPHFIYKQLSKTRL